MNKIRSRQVERLIGLHFAEKRKNVYLAGKVPPMMVIQLSNQFPSLNLAKEEILLLLNNFHKKVFCGLCITGSNVYVKKDGKEVVIPIDQIEKEYKKADVQLLGLPNELQLKLDAMFTEIAEGKLNASKAEMDSLLMKMKLEDAPAGEKIPLVIEKEYLEMARVLGDQLSTAYLELNEDKAFLDTLHKMIGKGEALVDKYKAEHVITQDLIKIYNEIDGLEDGIKEDKAKFLLAYSFERLQGKDMSSALSLERINKLVSNPKFEDGIETIKKAEFLSTKKEYQKELLLPSILNRMKHGLIEPIATAYIRFANMLIKADGEISKAEEGTLKKIVDQVSRPKKILPNVKQSEVPEGETLEQVMAEMNQLFGLDHIKKEIGELANFLKIQKIREEQGMKVGERSLHSVFMGPPGTGKTTIARLLARIFKHLGYLDKGQLVETDRAGMVAGYIGQTAIKVDEIVQTALDGVLFIDEAYSLTQGGNSRDFGNEAVEALLKRMEDHRKQMVVIVAGYPDEMENFINSNPGLKSRFNRFFKFDHYTGKELLGIFKIFAKKADFELSAEAEDKLSFIFDGLYEKRNPSFGNARVARNLFEQCITRQANRIVSISPLTREVLVMLEEPDIPPIKETIDKVMVFKSEE